MAVKKNAVKEAEVKAEAVEVKEAAPKKTTARKAAAPKNETAPKKEAAPKTETVTTAREEAAPVKEKAPKKTAVKKAAAPEATVYVEYADKKVIAKEVLAAAVASYKAAHADTEIETIEVYMKPEENVAYYVVNGEGSSDYKVEL
ncbi:MAG: hypothetical protein HFG62_16605 [Lachnospiraceae bacterium]|jgi:hypothetical protein|nr:hypothetical protein [Lachnospiraceae bacterium]MCI8960713.1 hypothetical protein [Lachnospiraceae bacterium]